MRFLRLNLAWRVTLLYAFLGGLWVLLSDRLLSALTADPRLLTEIQSYKGWGFVAASAALIYFLLRHELKRRRHIEKELQESEQHFREIVENAQAGYFFIDAEGCYRAVNQAWLTMHGYDSAAEVIGQSFSITQVETDLEQARQLGEQVLEGEPILSDEFSRRCKDGSIKFHTYSSRPVIKGSQVIGLEGFMIDITGRKQAEEALRESEAKYRSLFENSVMGISQALPDGCLVSVNAAYAHMYGYASPAEMLAEVSHVGQQLYAHPEDRAEVLRILTEKGVMEPREMAVVRRDGSMFFVLVGTREVRDAAGNLRCYQAEHIDITERKHMEQQLAKSAAQLRSLSQRLVKTQEMERRRIARELHDEVGQVILAVKTNLETMRLALGSATLNERLTESIDIVSRALEQIRTLALNLRPSLLDDFGLIPTLEWYLERQAKDVPFKINFQTDLPDMRFAPDIETNCFRVTQAALTNITRHAQATQVEVTLHLMPDTQELALSVRDDGIGFDVPAALEQARHGESLGLLGMQERIQLVGGQIAIESAPGRGTEIRARVPIKTDLSGLLGTEE